MARLAEPWIARSTSTSTSDSRQRPRLFCLPYAGGGAALYRAWASDPALAHIEVCPIQLPGRETRLLEPPFARMQPLVAALGDALQPYLDRPFALFGHSMGGLIGFELARAFRRNGQRAPERLFVSACAAPDAPRQRDPIHAKPHAEFIRSLRDLQGTQESVLQNEELMQLLMPTLRADFALVETYRCASELRLECPISVFGGTLDAAIDASRLADWAEHTSADFNLRMVHGTHFFIADQAGRERLTEGIGRDLAPLTQRVLARL